MVFLFVVSTTLSEITRTQLIQDKFCLNNYNKSRQYCIELKETKANGQEDDTVNNILADVATFSSYTLIISTLPGFFYVLFIGSWIDQYIHARKIILCTGMVGYACWYALQLLNAIYFDWGKLTIKLEMCKRRQNKTPLSLKILETFSLSMSNKSWHHPRGHKTSCLLG